MPCARSILAALFLALLVTGKAGACSTPVFRYALENWQPSAYEAIVFHSDRPDAAARKACDALEKAATEANLTVRVVGPDAVNERLAKLRQRAGARGEAPWLVLRGPRAGENDPPVWSGPLVEADVHAVLDSPARRAVVQRLVRGDTAVFLLLTSAKEQENVAAESLLARELPRLERSTKLPEPLGDGPPPRTTLPLRVAFSTVRLRRDDPAERPLVHMLLSLHEEVQSEKGPIVFPIFGRGRVLDGLPANDLQPRQLDKLAAFICGACSCEVKDLNPGTDLLVSARWNELLGIKDEGLQETPPVLDALPSTTDSEPAPSAAAPPGRPAWLYIAVVAAAVLVLITGARGLRPRPPTP